VGDHPLKFGPGQAVTFTATTALAGGQVVEVTGDRKVGVSGAASTKAVGTAAHDAAVDDAVVVHLAGPVDTMTAAAAIAAGSAVESAASGKAQTATTGRVLGIALTAAARDGDPVQVTRI